MENILYVYSKTRRPFRQTELLSLYRKVAKLSGGIARSEEEISEDYIMDFMYNGSLTGIELVVEHPDNPDVIIAEIHAYKSVPKAFAHVLTNLTIAVDKVS